MSVYTDMRDIIVAMQEILKNLRNDALLSNFDSPTHLASWLKNMRIEALRIEDEYIKIKDKYNLQ